VEAGRPEPSPNGDLLPVLVVLWVLSAVRVAVGFARGDYGSTEQTIALAYVALGLCVVLAPALRWLGRDGTPTQL
jgi:hypothetical protein